MPDDNIASLAQSCRDVHAVPDLDAQTGLSAEQRRLRAQIAVNQSWAKTKDRKARTAKGREARDQQFRDQARELLGPDATDEAVERSAEHLRQAHMQRMALLSVRARKAKAEARRDAR